MYELIRMNYPTDRKETFLRPVFEFSCRSIGLDCWPLEYTDNDWEAGFFLRPVFEYSGRSPGLDCFVCPHRRVLLCANNNQQQQQCRAKRKRVLPPPGLTCRLAWPLMPPTALKIEMIVLFYGSMHHITHTPGLLTETSQLPAFSENRNMCHMY